MSRCRITVIKRTVNQDLVDAYLDPASDFGKSFGVCNLFQDGQIIEVAAPWAPPEGFCPWAWADLRRELLAVANGASYPWLKEPGVALAQCSDALRPVYFKIERLD